MTRIWLILLIASGLHACQKHAPADTPPPLRINWRPLGAVQFEARYVPALQDSMPFPTQFGDTLRALAGRQIQLEGYFIPLGNGKFALSAFPNAACFFCGRAGIETVVELRLPQAPPGLHLDDWHCFTGTLGINTDLATQTLYTLHQAQPGCP